MNKIIGYAKAKALMQEGCTVREVKQFRGGNIPYIRKPDGTRFEDGNLDLRIRSDSWDKLRRECHIVRKEPGPGKLSASYVWTYGDAKSWYVTYEHPADGKRLKGTVVAATREEAEVKAHQDCMGWTIIDIVEA